MTGTALKTRRIQLPFAAVDKKPYIFASYGHDDKNVVFPLLKKLYESGYNVWYDEGITIGARYEDVIEKHIRESAVFLFFTSNLSVSRPYIIENELPIAYQNRENCPILSLHIEKDVAVPDKVAAMLPKNHLRSIQQVMRTLRKRNMPHFGKRTAVPIERDIPLNWYDSHGNDAVNGTLINNVFCKETPYACLVFHPYDVNACNPFTKELYLAGYNVRSFEYDTDKTRASMISDPDCKAFVPFVTKNYLESGMLERDYQAAKAAGKPLIWLNIPARNKEGQMESADISRLPDDMSLRQGLDLHTLTNSDFLSKLEAELEKNNCYASRTNGHVERREFEIDNFYYDFTEDKKGIIITKLKDEDDRMAITCVNAVRENTIRKNTAPQTSFLQKMINKVSDFLWGQDRPVSNAITVAKTVASTNLNDIVIKSSYEGYPVAEIGEGAFAGSDMTSLRLPDGLKYIGDLAFTCCDGLTSVTIPGSVTGIGEDAFSCCDNLTSVMIPQSVNVIEKNAFWGCEKLTSINIPSGVKKIEEGTFLGCESLTSVVIPDSVTEIGPLAFCGCDSLTSITLPNSVKSIGDSAFVWCSSLMSVRLPGSVTSIGSCAFQGCENLSSLTVPYSLESVGESAFAKCSHLTSVTISDGAKIIGEKMFSECGSLTSVTIPGSVTSIGNSAFSQCGSLTSVTISDGVKSIEQNAFNGCGRLTSVTIPDSVKEIGDNVFSGCNNDLIIYCVKGSKAWKCYRDYMRCSPILSKKRILLLIFRFAAVTLLAAAAGLQLLGLFDLLGWLGGLPG